MLVIRVNFKIDTKDIGTSNPHKKNLICHKHMFQSRTSQLIREMQMKTNQNSRFHLWNWKAPRYLIFDAEECSNALETLKGSKPLAFSFFFYRISYESVTSFFIALVKYNNK